MLVIHPAESFYGYTFRSVTPLTREMDDALLDAMAQLLEAHIDFDFGEEDMLARRGAVRGRKLRLHKAAYEGVLLPQLKTIRATTLRLLEAFAAGGGKVWYTGEIPARMDGTASAEPARVYAAFKAIKADNLAGALDPKLRRVSVAQDGVECADVFVQLRRSTQALTLFACNTSTRAPHKVDELFSAPRVIARTDVYPRAEITVKSAFRGAVYEVDPRTGGIAHQAQTT